MILRISYHSIAFWQAMNISEIRTVAVSSSDFQAIRPTVYSKRVSFLAKVTLKRWNNQLDFE